MGLANFFSPCPNTKNNRPPKIGTQNSAISSILGGIGFVFWGLEQNNLPNCPGRKNTQHNTSQKTSINATYIESIQQQETGSQVCTTPTYFLTKGEAMPTRGRVEDRQSYAVEGWRGADATSMTSPCALSNTAVAC